MTTSEALSSKSTSQTFHPPQALTVARDLGAVYSDQRVLSGKLQVDVLLGLAAHQNSHENIMRRFSQAFRTLGNEIEKDIPSRYVFRFHAHDTFETRPSDVVSDAFLEILKDVKTPSVTFQTTKMSSPMLPKQAVPYSGVHLEEVVGTPSPWEVYEARFAELDEAAEEEGICPLKADSKDDFKQFLGFGFPVRRAAVTLSDDGMLGATWRNKKWRLDLTFLGKGKIEYILLDRSNPPDGKTGTDNLENFNIEFKQFDLEELLVDEE